MDGKRAEKRRYGILLAIVAASILVLGLLFKPQDKLRPPPQDARVEAVRADLNNLRELAQRNTLRNTSNRFSALASADAAFLLDTNRDQTAIIWSDEGLVISAGSRAPAGLRVALKGNNVTATPKTWGAGLPFTLYQARNRLPAAASTAKLDDLEPGTWMVVDALGPHGPEFVTGMYSGTGRATCEGVDYDKVLLGAPFDARFAGSGMFDIDGDLIAVLAQCDHGVAAIPVAEIAAHVEDLNRPEQAPFGHLGFAAKPIAPPLDLLLPNSSGMVVTDVWTNWPAGVAGLVPGDILLAVNDAPALSVQQVAGALQHMPVQLRVQRSRHVIATITLSSGDAPPAIEVQAQNDGIVVSNVSSAVETKLGLRSGDRILSLDGRSATSRSVTQLLAAPAGSPSLLTVERGTRQFLVVVPG